MNLMDLFKCECGNDELMFVEGATHLYAPVLEVEEGIVSLGDEQVYYTGDRWYECTQCAFKPEDEDGDYIKDSINLWYWLNERFGDKETEDFSPRPSEEYSGTGTKSHKFRRR